VALNVGWRPAAAALLLVFALGACRGEAAAPATTAPAAAPAAAPSGAAPPAAAPQPAQRTALRVGYSAVDASQAPLWVAHDAGIFTANGLDVELLFVESGSKALQTLIAGEVPVGFIAAAAIVSAVAGGAEVSILASMADRYPYKVMAVPSARQMTDLRGQRFGVSRFGSSSDLATRAALKLSGINDSDVQIIQIGGDVQRVTALQTGAIDAAVLNPPATTVVRKGGFNEVIDLSRLPDSDYQHTTAVATRGFIATQAGVVDLFVRSLVQEIRHGYADKEATKEAIKHYNGLEDTEGLDEAYLQYYAPDAMMLTRAPHVKPKSLATTIEEAATDRPEARRLRYEDLVDDRFVQALETNGFVRQTWGE
jgi:NitT/TauT family transport system substrate-binding protein